MAEITGTLRGRARHMHPQDIVTGDDDSAETTATGSSMFAVYADSLDADDPLTGLALGDRPEPGTAPAGWTVVTVRASALNHHDLWSRRGVGSTPDRLPMILGTDAAGVDPDGNEVVVHAVISDPTTGSATRRSTRNRSLLSERHQGTLAQRVAVPRRNLVPKPAALSFEEAVCRPTAWLTAYRMLFSQARSPRDPRSWSRGRRGVATALIALGAAAGRSVWVTSQTIRTGRPRNRARCRRGLRVRRTPTRAGGRRHGDGGCGDVAALVAIASPGRNRRALRATGGRSAETN